MRRNTLVFVIACMMTAMPVFASAMSADSVFHSLWCGFERIFGYACADAPDGVLTVNNPIPSHTSAQKQSSPQGQIQTGEVVGDATAAAAAAAAGAVSQDADDDFNTEQFIQRREIQTQMAEMRRESDLARSASVASVSQAPQAYEAAQVIEGPQSIPSAAAYASDTTTDYGADIASLWRAISLMNRVDTLSNVTITNATASGNFSGTFNGAASIPAAPSSGGFTTGDATATSFAITDIPNALLSTNAQGSVVAATSVDPSYLAGIDKAFFFSTTSADAWDSQRDQFSTTSALYFLSQNTGNAFSTTSANAWSTFQNYFSTSSASYFLQQNQATAFSTTSAAFFLSQNQSAAFSTTSADSWSGLRSFFSTSSAAFFLLQNQATAFSTTSASYFLSQSAGSAFSTTSANAWSAFQNYFSTTSSSYFLSQNQGSAFSTTSAAYWSLQNNFFSTTSANYWSSVQNYFSTSSSQYFLSQNQTSAFSTTSANFLINSSSTIVTTNKSPVFAGTLSAATATAAIVDTQGQVCNVVAYGAKGDNVTDNYAAITAAMAACPVGGIIYFPPGQYRISQTIFLDKPVTFRGSYAPRWSYDSAPRSSIKAATPFTGTALIHVRENTISGQPASNDGGRILNMSLDGNSYGTGIDGIYFEGLVRDWKLVDVDISQTSGDGFEAAQGAGTSNARGFTIQHLSIYSPGGHGFRASSLNDSSIDDLLVVGGAQRGIYLTSEGETKISNSRAVFNALEGLYIDGASTNGGLQFTNFSTDRNDRQGVRISATGTTSISFEGLLTRRDGPNTGGGTETPYAGVAIIGTSTGYVAPVIIDGLTQIPGVNDDGTGTPSPAVGVRAQYSTYVRVNGVLWGTTNAFLDLGNNNNSFVVGEGSLLKVGYSSVTSTLYNAMWALSTTTSQSLVYYGKVGVGTSTPTAQFQTTGTVRLSNFGAGTLQTDAYGNLSVSSDERLKNIQGPFETGLAALLDIHPILYHWNAASGFDQTTLYAGFSAQNVQAAIPEAVGTDPHGFLTLSDRPILAALVNAVQELYQTVTGNTQKIDDLEARVSVLEAKLDVTPPANNTGTTTQPETGNAASSTTQIQPDETSAPATPAASGDAATSTP